MCASPFDAAVHDVTGKTPTAPAPSAPAPVAPAPTLMSVTPPQNDNTARPASVGTDSETAPSADADQQKLATVTELPTARRVPSATKPARPVLRGPIGSPAQRLGTQLRKTISGTLGQLGIHPRSTTKGTDTGPATSDSPGADSSTSGSGADNNAGSGAAA